jgi:hypothetical protein
MAIADFYPNLRHRGVVILLKVNDCYGPDLLSATKHRYADVPKIETKVACYGVVTCLVILRFR